MWFIFPYKYWLKDKWYQIRDHFHKKLYGYSPVEIANLNYELIKWLYPRIKIFREKCYGWPVTIVSTMKEWKEILGEIEYACEFFIYMEKGTEGKIIRDTDLRYIRMEKGFELLGKYIQYLWT